MDKLGTQTTFNYTDFLSNIKYLSFQNVNLTSGKLLLFLLRLLERESFSLVYILQYLMYCYNNLDKFL